MSKTQASRAPASDQPQKERLGRLYVESAHEDLGPTVFTSLPSAAVGSNGADDGPQTPGPLIISSNRWVDADSSESIENLLFQARIVSAIGDAFIATDADLNVRIINAAAERLYGITAQDARGQLLADLIETELGNSYTFADVLRETLSAGRWSGCLRQRCPDGDWIDVDVSMLAVRDDTGVLRGAVTLGRNVTPLRRAEREAAERTEFAAAVLESLPGRTCVLDTHGTVIATNRRYRAEGPTGAGEASGPALGSDYLSWLSEHIKVGEIEDLRELLRGKCPDFRTEFSSVRRRKRQWTELFAVPLGLRHGGAVVTHVDITARKQAETALTRRATHDSLTGLPNRVLLADRLAQDLSRAGRTKSRVGLLFCDLDGFRDVNNTHGHLAGDRLLVTIAKRLRAVCRSSDTVARVSGDEFVIILEDVSGRTEIEEVSQRIIEALSEPVQLQDGEQARTGVSIGLVISSGVPRAGTRTVENLINDADAAMYAAKEAGRGRYAWFSPEMRERPRERPTFVQAINRLLNR